PKIVESKTTHRINDRLSINYLEFAPYFPVQGRDVCFVQYLSRQRNGTYVVLWNSIKDPDLPKKKGVVRATMATSGFVVAPLQKQVISSKISTYFTILYCHSDLIPVAGDICSSI